MITGSANFSDASTKTNDENMLLIRGDTRVADLSLSEFMRLFNHFQFRDAAQARTATGENHCARYYPGQSPRPAPAADRSFLATTDEWKDSYYVKDIPKCLERTYFAGPSNRQSDENNCGRKEFALRHRMKEV